MLEHVFFYVPRPLIDRAPGNDATSLTTYTTHSRASDTNIYIIYTLNPVESNYRDGPTGHKNILCIIYIVLIINIILFIKYIIVTYI